MQQEAAAQGVQVAAPCRPRMARAPRRSSTVPENPSPSWLLPIHRRNGGPCAPERTRPGYRCTSCRHLLAPTPQAGATGAAEAACWCGRTAAGPGWRPQRPKGQKAGGAPFVALQLSSGAPLLLSPRALAVVHCPRCVCKSRHAPVHQTACSAAVYHGKRATWPAPELTTVCASSSSAVNALAAMWTKCATSRCSTSHAAWIIASRRQAVPSS